MAMIDEGIKIKKPKYNTGSLLSQPTGKTAAQMYIDSAERARQPLAQGLTAATPTASTVTQAVSDPNKAAQMYIDSAARAKQAKTVNTSGTSGTSGANGISGGYTASLLSAESATPTATETPSSTAQTYSYTPTGQVNSQVGEYANFMASLYGANWQDPNFRNTLDLEERATFDNNYGYYNMLNNNFIAYQYEADEAKRNAEIARQQQYINAQLMLAKYLPTQLKAQGMGNLGVSQSAYIDANNSYMNRVNAINSEEQARINEAIRLYTQESSDADYARRAANADIEDAYLAEKQARAYEKVAGQIEAMLGYVGTADQYGNVHLTGEALQTARGLLEENKDNMSKSDYAELEALLGDMEEYDIAEMQPRATGESLVGKTFSRSNEFASNNWLEKTSRLLAPNVKVSSSNPYTIDDLLEESSKYLKGENQTARIEAIKNAVASGNMANGTVVDINYGAGGKFYVYYDGYFYPAKAGS